MSGDILITSGDQLLEASRLLDQVDTETTSIETDIEIAKARALIAIGIRLGAPAAEFSKSGEPL